MRDTFYYVYDREKVFCENCINPIKADIELLIHADETNDKTSLALSNLKKFAENKNEATKEEINQAYGKFSRKIKSKEQKEGYETYQQHKAEQNERFKNVTFVDVQNVLATTSDNFEGYNISKYLDIVGGDVALGTGFLSEFSAAAADLFGDESGALTNKMEEAREAALLKMKKRAVVLGANAVIGVRFDLTSMARNMIGLSATGTAVIVEERY